MKTLRKTLSFFDRTSYFFVMVIGKKLLIFLISMIPFFNILVIGAVITQAVAIYYFNINMHEVGLAWVAYIGGIMMWGIALSKTFPLIRWKPSAS